MPLAPQGGAVASSAAVGETPAALEPTATIREWIERNRANIMAINFATYEAGVDKFLIGQLQSIFIETASESDRRRVDNLVLSAMRGQGLSSPLVFLEQFAARVFLPEAARGVDVAAPVVAAPHPAMPTVAPLARTPQEEREAHSGELGASQSLSPPLAATPEGLSTWEQACKDATAWMQALQADSSRNTGNRARILLAQWRQWPSPDVFLGELFSQKALQEMIGLDEGEYDKDALEAYLQQQIEEPAPPPAAPVEVVPPHVEPRTLLTAYLSPWLTEVGPVVRDMEAKKPLQVFLKNAVGSAEGQEALVNELLKQRTIQDALANPRVTTALSIALNKLFVLTDEQAEAIIGKWILVPFPSFWGHRDTPVYKMIAEAVAIDRAAPNGTRQWDKKIKDIWAEAKRHLPLKEGVNVHALAQYLRDIDPLPAGDISGVF